jgi:hypothetical protein
MPRVISASLRRALESRYSGDANLVFVTISNPVLSEPIRIVNDTVDFSYDGHAWVGFPIDLALLSDDDQPPKAQVTFQNVDRKIGMAIRNLVTPPRLKIELLHSRDFDLTVTPRAPIAPPAVEYRADKLWLTNITVDALEVTADIQGWDYLQRAWPGQRATQDLLPGLFF